MFSICTIWFEFYVVMVNFPYVQVFLKNQPNLAHDLVEMKEESLVWRRVDGLLEKGTDKAVKVIHCLYSSSVWSLEQVMHKVDISL